MDANTMYVIGLSGFGLAFLNAGLWLYQWASERRWKFIGHETRQWCLHRMWISLGLALLFAVVGSAGWCLRA